MGISSGGGISKLLFRNKFAVFLGSLSMEIYLCHMFVYRMIERLKLNHIILNELFNYMIVVVITIFGAIILAYIFKTCLKNLEKKLAKK